MKKKLASILVSLGILLGTSVAIAPSASALNVYYKGTTRCYVGVYPVLSYTQWFKVYDYNWYEETVLGKRDYSVWSHNDTHYNIYYPNSTCNVWGYIVP